MADDEEKNSKIKATQKPKTLFAKDSNEIKKFSVSSIDNTEYLELLNKLLKEKHPQENKKDS